MKDAGCSYWNGFGGYLSYHVSRSAQMKSEMPPEFGLASNAGDVRARVVECKGHSH